MAYQYVAMVLIPGLFFLICLGCLPFALLSLFLLPKRLGLRWGRYNQQGKRKVHRFSNARLNGLVRFHYRPFGFATR